MKQQLDEDEMNKDMRDRLTLASLRERMRGWSPGKVGLFWFIVCFVVLSLIGAMLDRAHADTGLTPVEPDGAGDAASFDGYTDWLFSQSPDADVIGIQPLLRPAPRDDATFISNFKNNWYGHTRANIHYSAAFRSFWYASQEAHASSVGHQPNCVSASSTGPIQCTWQRFQNHDTCIVGSLPDTFSTNSCTFGGSRVDWNSYLQSPYWTQRGDLQNKWTARIVFCGTVGLISLFAKNSAIAGIFGGAGGTCMASRVVP